MKPIPKSFRVLLIILLLLISVLPAVFIAKTVYREGINFPVWDEWGFAPFFEKASNGSLSIKDFFSQVNESRKVFPKIAFLAVAKLSNWDLRYEMAIIFLLACIISLNIFLLAKKSVKGSSERRLLLFFLANLFIFSFAQYENFFWGIQISVFLPLVCLTAGLLLFFSKMSLKWKIAVGILLSFVSTFSYVGGLLVWIVLFPAIFFSSSWKGFLKNKNYALAWLISFFLTLNIYFAGYQKPPYHPSLFVVFQKPIEGIVFFFSFLGSPVSQVSYYSRDFLCPIVGFVLFAFFAFAVCYFFRNLKKDVSRRMFPWLLVGAYAILTSMLTVIGRLGFGTEQTFESRYATPSLYIVVALIFLAAILYADLKRHRNIALLVIVTFLVLLLVLHFFSSSLALSSFHYDNTLLAQGRGALLFANVIDDPASLKEVFDSKNFLMLYANLLDGMHYINPPMINSNRIQNLRQIHGLESQMHGSFEKFTCDEHNCTAYGWAILSGKKKSAGAVILSYESADGSDIVFAAADNVIGRKDVVSLFGEKSYLYSGWSKTIAKDEVPSSAIKAWAFDPENEEAFLLDGAYAK